MPKMSVPIKPSYSATNPSNKAFPLIRLRRNEFGKAQTIRDKSDTFALTLFGYAVLIETVPFESRFDKKRNEIIE